MSHLFGRVWQGFGQDLALQSLSLAPSWAQQEDVQRGAPVRKKKEQKRKTWHPNSFAFFSCMRLINTPQKTLKNCLGKRRKEVKTI